MKYNTSAQFQSTPLHEGRLSAQLHASQLHGFQSTPLHEGRHHETAFLYETARFNPRPYTRGDVIN